MNTLELPVTGLLVKAIEGADHGVAAISRDPFSARLTSLVNAFIVIVAFHFRRSTTSLITGWTVPMIDDRPGLFFLPFVLCAMRGARINLRASFCTSLSRNATMAL